MVFCISPSVRIVDGYKACIAYDSANKRAFGLSKELGRIVSRTRRFTSFAQFRRILEEGLCCTRFRKRELDRVLSEIRKSTIYIPESQLASSPTFKFETVPPDRPRRAKIEVTSACNLKCQYCYASSATRGTQIRRSRLLSIIRELSTLGVDVVEFTGGEPLLNGHLREYISAASSYSMNVRLATNGTLLDDEMIAFLLTNKVEIQISLHGIPAEYSSGGGSGRILDPRTATAIKKIAQLNPELLLLTHIMDKDTACAVSRLTEYAGNLKARIVLGRPFKVGTAIGNWNVVRIPEDDLRYPCCDEDMNCEISLRCAPCNLDSICVLHNGKVSTCVLLRSKDVALGSIFDASLSDMWASDRRRYLSSIRVDDIPICRSCEYKYICGGGCMASCFSLLGRVGEPSPHCVLQKVEVKRYYAEKFGIDDV